MKYVVVLLLSFAMGSGIAGELREREEGKEESGRLFRHSDFAELERLAEHYRQESPRTSSGTFKLALFYDGIGEKGLGYPKEYQDEWREALGRFDTWIERYPDSPTPYIARAAALMGRAWTMRGYGYSSGVSREHMQQYHLLSAEAGEYLMEHSELRSKDPHWYNLMEHVYMALGVPKDAFWELYVEALGRYPDYDPLIFVAGNFYSPLWYGSPEDVERLARFTSEETESTRDFAPYARLYWIAGEKTQQYAFSKSAEDWNDMVRGMDAVIERYPSQWNVQHFTFFACLQGDRATAGRYMLKVERPLLNQAWNDSRNYDICRGFVSSGSTGGQ